MTFKFWILLTAALFFIAIMIADWDKRDELTTALLAMAGTICALAACLEFYT